MTSGGAQPSDCHKYVSVADFDWTFNRTGPLPWSPGVYSIIAVFTGLALWSTIHLLFRIFFFFKRYHGLYFWSLIITSCSLSIRAVGFLLRWVAPNVPWQFSLFLAEAGWVGMVTGFSIVLWSRLNIIIFDKRVLRGVLAMIIVNGFIWHTALVILQYGLAAAKGSQRGPWLRVLNPFERVQITLFTVQESIITLMYIWATYKILVDRIVQHRQTTRRVLILLFVVQTGTLMLDIIIITLDLAGYFTLKAILHSWVYGIKLELEFVVLNQLVDIAKSGVPGLSSIKDDTVPNVSLTESTESEPNTQPQNASPDSSSALKNKQPEGWWPPLPAEVYSSARSPSSASSSSKSSKSSVSKSPRESLVHRHNHGLGLIREDRQLGFEEFLSLDRIGVIPDTSD